MISFTYTIFIFVLPVPCKYRDSAMYAIYKRRHGWSEMDMVHICVFIYPVLPGVLSEQHVQTAP